MSLLCLQLQVVKDYRLKPHITYDLHGMIDNWCSTFTQFLKQQIGEMGTYIQYTFALSLRVTVRTEQCFGPDSCLLAVSKKAC